MSFIIVHRLPYPSRNYERWVRVVGLGMTQRIDPAEEVFQATGLRVDRTHCILSFMNGLVAAGYEVFSTDTKSTLRHHPTSVSCPIFWLVGSCVGRNRNEWEHLKKLLDRCCLTTNDRFKVLSDTAEHFFHRPPSWTESLYLVIK